MSRYPAAARRRIRLAVVALTSGQVVHRNDVERLREPLRRRAERAEARAAALEGRVDVLKTRLAESRAATKQKAELLQVATRRGEAGATQR